MLHTTSSLCHVDFEAPSVAGAAKRRRRSALPQPDAARSAGANFRVLPLENPCLLCTYTSTDAALLVTILTPYLQCCSLALTRDLFYYHMFPQDQVRQATHCAVFSRFLAFSPPITGTGLLLMIMQKASALVGQQVVSTAGRSAWVLNMMD